MVLRPTNRCNLRCKMCFDYGENTVSETWPGDAAGPLLSAKMYHSLIDELAAFNPTFYITGGEPLLSDHIFPIISAIKSRGFYVSLNTNGTLLNEHAQNLVESKIDKIIISIDGPPAVHDAIRGETFELIAEGIATLNALKKSSGSPTPYLRVQCVISPDNIPFLEQMPDVIRGLGINEIRFQHLMFTFAREDFHIDEFIKSIAIRASISTFLPPEDKIDIKILREKLFILKSNKTSPLVIGYEPEIRPGDLEGYYRDPDYSFANFCLSPWRRLDISPSGEMGPCPSIYLGKYPELTPSQVWRGDSFKTLRQEIIKNGLFSHCLRCCHREYYPPRISLAIS